jgi:uncharacterized protein (TIGR02246 family)
MKIADGVAIDDDLKAIAGVLTTQEKAWSEGDFDSFFAGYWNSDQLTFIGSSGIQYGWTATVERFKKTYGEAASRGEQDFTILKADRLADDVISVVGKYRLVREGRDNAEGYFSLTWRKMDGSWLVTADHSS